MHVSIRTPTISRHRNHDNNAYLSNAHVHVHAYGVLSSPDPDILALRKLPKSAQLGCVVSGRVGPESWLHQSTPYLEPCSLSLGMLWDPQSRRDVSNDINTNYMCIVLADVMFCKYK